MFSFLIAVFLSLPASTRAGTSHFKLELTWGKGAPDGYERDMIFINGQFPGPLLEIPQGDWVEIEVLNSMPYNSTIHAHGVSCIHVCIIYLQD
jgi:FtsP/CotA-like multicopper oxidase with cupredoxin domain